MPQDLSIYECRDYRDFLKHRFETEKAKNPKFSYQFCAKRLKTARGYMGLVIQKRRHITIDKVPPIAKLFAFSELEQEYFTFLFLKNAAKDAKLSRYFEVVLMNIYGRELGAYRRPSTQDASLFQDWLLMVIESMTQLPDFRPDPKWMQHRMGLDNKELPAIQQAWKTLQAKGLVSQAESGTKTMHLSEPQSSDPNSRQIYRVGLRRTDEILENAFFYRPNHFHMLAISLNYEDEKKLIGWYIDFRDRIIELAKNSREPESVFFLSNNLFAATPPHLVAKG